MSPTYVLNYSKLQRQRQLPTAAHRRYRRERRQPPAQPSDTAPTLQLGATHRSAFSNSSGPPSATTSARGKSRSTIAQIYNERSTSSPITTLHRLCLKRDIERKNRGFAF